MDYKINKRMILEDFDYSDIIDSAKESGALFKDYGYMHVGDASKLNELSTEELLKIRNSGVPTNDRHTYKIIDNIISSRNNNADDGAFTSKYSDVYDKAQRLGIVSDTIGSDNIVNFEKLKTLSNEELLKLRHFDGFGTNGLTNDSGNIIDKLLRDRASSDGVQPVTEKPVQPVAEKPVQPVAEKPTVAPEEVNNAGKSTVAPKVVSTFDRLSNNAPDSRVLTKEEISGYYNGADEEGRAKFDKLFKHSNGQLSVNDMQKLSDSITPPEKPKAYDWKSPAIAGAVGVGVAGTGSYLHNKHKNKQVAEVSGTPADPVSKRTVAGTSILGGVLGAGGTHLYSQYS
jgi:hypothetical protein